MLFVTGKDLHAGVLHNISRDMGYSATIYNSDTGYPISSTKAIVQTPDGFVWIGGYTGLLRYDGKTFLRVGKKEILSVTTMWVGQDNRLWLGTNDKGVALYENGAFRFWGKDKGLGSNSVRKIVGDGQGHIIAASTNGLAYIDRTLTLHPIKDPRLDGKYIRDVDSDGQGNVAGITRDGDFFLISDLTVKSYRDAGHLGFSKPRSVNFDTRTKDAFYLGMKQAYLVRMQFASDSDKVSYIPTGNFTSINTMHVTEDGEVWLCSDDGIGYLDNRQKFHPVSCLEMDNSVEDMMVDYEGNAWFVSSRQGLLKIVENRFNFISSKAQLPKMVINTTVNYHEDLYLGTDSGLYIIDSGFQQKTNALTEMFKGIRIRCIKKDSFDNLWFCTFSNMGLVKCDPKGKTTIYNKKNGLYTNRVRALVETSYKDILASGDGGINILRDGMIVGGYNNNFDIFFWRRG